MTQIPILKGDDEKMRKKHSTITLILIQLFVISAMVGAMSPTVSATQNDANTITSNPDFPELPAREDIDFDWFDRADDFKPEFVPGEILVKFRTSISTGLTDGIVTSDIASVNKLNKRFEANGIERVFSDVYKLTLPKDTDVLSVAREYEADPNVEYAEPNGIYYTSVVPNDANYTQQWAHQMIESESAWNATTGDPSVVIAIVDTGVDWDHLDLENNIWINTAEYSGQEGVDDDENGFVDDIRGWDFYENDNNTIETFGHGTHCAGIAAAVTNNSIGVAGVSWHSRIMALRGGPGPGLPSDALAGSINYAADNGADIISMSWGSYGRSEVIYNALKNAYDLGLLLVAAAGNDETNDKLYPAAFEEVIAVTATDQNDNPASFTNFGDWVELAAPGVNILSTVSKIHIPYFQDDDYSYADGTSMACPHVAGVASLIWSQFPDMTRDEVRYQLRRTAVDLGDSGFDIYYGYGRINASGAVNQDRPDHDLIAWDWKLPFASEPGDTVMVNTTVLNFGKNTERNVYVKLLVNGTEEDSKKIKVLNSGESATVSHSWTPTAEGKHNVTTYVVPVRSENVIENNALSAYSGVRFGKTVRVRDDFPTIKEAIEASNLGIYYGDATIWVASGTYNEYDLVIDNSLTSLALVGEDRNTTIISGATAHAGVLVWSDNVTVTGFTIQNMGDLSNPGILVTSNNNVVSDNRVTNNLVDGIVSFGYNNTVENNIVSNHNRWGIWVGSSSSSTITNNTLSNNGVGLTVTGSEIVIISSNTIADSGFSDISLFSSSDNVLTNNVLTGNFSFYVYGSQLAHFIHDIDTSNTVNGKPIYYLINQSDLVIDPSTFQNIGYLGLVNSTNITVKDLTLSNNGQGVLFAYTKDSKIHNVTASYDLYGILLVGSNNTIVSDNTFTYNLHGVYTETSNNNTLRNNLLSDNNYGINLETSSDNFIYHNNFIDNTEQLTMSSSSNTTWDDGEGRGNYWSDYNGTDTDRDGIGDTELPWLGVDYYPLINPVIRVPQDYSTIQAAINAADDDTLIRVASGTYYENVVVADDLTLIGEDPSTTIIDGGGISTKNVVTIKTATATISGFTIQNGGRSGIKVHLCPFGGTVIGNMITNNFVGISIEDYTQNVQIADNTVSYNTFGIYLLYTENNTISSNTLSNNGYTLTFMQSDSNTVKENTISNNWYNIDISSYSDNNVIYHNNFINNTVQTPSSGGTNVWDDGYPSGGNFWSDYTGTDLYSGPYQNETGSDGIGDTPYVINQNNQDNYPFMYPITVNLAITNVTTCKTIVGQGYIVHINVTVQNQGAFTETFNVTVYGNTTTIGSQTVTLTRWNTTTVTFTWNTTGVAYSYYSISAVADTVLGETDTSDNTLDDGIIMVTIPGDVNGDRIVDVFDIAEISAHWWPGPPPGPEGYDPNVDINHDGAIDIFDQGIASAHWGQSW